MTHDLALDNPLCHFIDKDRADFTRADLLRVIHEKGIERLTFRYTGGDGQLKELKLPIADLGQAERVLAAGERVDGSSLFKGMVDTALSDLYVVPVYRSAFLNPFDEGSLDLMCRFVDRNGELAYFTPDNILGRAYRRFQERTGFEFHTLGELEFFLLGDHDTDTFVPQRQAGYHASTPFFKSHAVVNDMVRHISQITGAIKYAHSEVGYIDALRSDRPCLAGKRAEQHEIEFLTRPIDEAADDLVLARWIIRNVAWQYGMYATFAPKLEEGVAGSGFHFHMELVKAGRNMMTDADGQLSEDAQKLIGGIVQYATTLSAFGNTVASAFLRLVPNQEAPTRICWSDANRSALIRVPLGWRGNSDMARIVNPNEKDRYVDERGHQTVELRSPDGSAQTHLILAGLVTAAEWGLTNPSSLPLARKTRVEGNIFQDKELLGRLEALPGSCVAASRLLAERRAMYEEFGVFPKQVIDHMIALLAREDDEFLNANLSHMSAEERLTKTRQVMHRDLDRH